MNQCPDCLSNLFGPGRVCSACGCVVDVRAPAAIQKWAPRLGLSAFLVVLLLYVIVTVAIFTVVAIFRR